MDDDRLSRIEAKLDRVVEDGARTRVALGEVRATLDAHVRQQSERTVSRDRRCGDHEDRLRRVEGTCSDDHEERIRGLERVRWMVVGAAAMVGAGAGEGVRALTRAIG